MLEYIFSGVINTWNFTFYYIIIWLEHDFFIVPNLQNPFAQVIPSNSFLKNKCGIYHYELQFAPICQHKHVFTLQHACHQTGKIKTIESYDFSIPTQWI